MGSDLGVPFVVVAARLYDNNLAILGPPCSS